MSQQKAMMILTGFCLVEYPPLKPGLKPPLSSGFLFSTNFHVDKNELDTEKCRALVQNFLLKVFVFRGQTVDIVEKKEYDIQGKAELYDSYGYHFVERFKKNHI